MSLPDDLENLIDTCLDTPEAVLTWLDEKAEALADDLGQKAGAIEDWVYRNRWKIAKTVACAGAFSVAVAATAATAVTVPAVLAAAKIAQVGKEMELRGHTLAKEAVEGSRPKTGIQIFDRKGKFLGDLSGARAGITGDIEGIDRSVPIDPKEFLPGGKLYVYYLALIMLEDNEHDAKYSKNYPWSDRYGVNSRMLWRILSTRGRAGGSSLSDQACGAMRDGLQQDQITSQDRKKLGETILFPIHPDSTGGQRLLEKIPNRMFEKLDETACGSALAQTFSPEEITAFLATYGYLSPGAEGIYRFAQRYWGFTEGINDSKLNYGHMLILASLLNHPWDPTLNGTRWNEIRDRAQFVARKLITIGVFKPQDLSSLYTLIDEAKPTYGAEKKDSVNPRPEYDVPLAQTVRELEGLEGDDFKSDVVSVTLTIDDGVQVRAKDEANEARRKVNDNARFVTLIRNEEGEIIALYTDDQVLKRFSQQTNMGSIGKVFLAAGVAEKGYGPWDKGPTQILTPEPLTVSPDPNPYAFLAESSDPALLPAPVTYSPLEEFKGNLTWSRDRIIENVITLGVSESFIAREVACYGTTNSVFLADPRRHAALGNYGLSPKEATEVMAAAVTGKPPPEAHIILSYTLRDGRVINVSGDRNEDEKEKKERERCAADLYQNGTTKAWLNLPLNGTAAAAAGVLSEAKTGTYCTAAKGRGQRCRSDESTAAVWIAGARQVDADKDGKKEWYFGVVGAMADDPHDSIGPKGTLSVNVAVPEARDVFRAIR